MARRSGGTGGAAAEGSGILGLQLCHAKRLTDGTSEPEPGLEAKPALAPGKSLRRGSRSSLGGSERALAPPEAARAPDPSASPPMVCHQPFGARDIELCSTEQPSACGACPGTQGARRCSGSACS